VGWEPPSGGFRFLAGMTPQRVFAACRSKGRDLLLPGVDRAGANAKAQVLLLQATSGRIRALARRAVLIAVAVGGP